MPHYVSREHHLKTWIPLYAHMNRGEKTFDYRKNDRDFQLGDTIIFEEYDQHNNHYTGMCLERKIKYILHGGQFGIPEGFCIMGI